MHQLVVLDAASSDDVARLPGPWEIIRPSEADTDDWERFPRGLPHLIASEGLFETEYYVRVRTHNGMLWVMPSDKTDLQSAREELRDFRGGLACVYEAVKGRDPSDPIEVRRGMEFELESGVDHRARIASGAFDPIEVAYWECFDGVEENGVYPDCYLFPLALGTDDDGGDKFGVALSWGGYLIPYRLMTLDLSLETSELIAICEERRFIEVFDDLAECKAAVLAALAESICLWGRHHAPFRPDFVGRPEWGPVPTLAVEASRPWQARR